jgi:hypothetical protein
MKRLLLFSILAIITSCDKKSFFVDQYNPIYNASPSFSGLSYCFELYGTMISPTEAIICTGSHALYTKDDFNTVQYYQYPNDITSCTSNVTYFDGINAWSRPIDRNSYRLLSRGPTVQLSGSFDNFVFDPPLAIGFRILGTKPFFLDSASFIFPVTEYAFVNNVYEPVANIYKGNAFKGTASKISSITLDKSTYQPISVQIANNTFIAVFSYSNYLANKNETYSFISNDGSTWQGPFLFTTIDPYFNILEGISGSGNTFVSRFYSLKDFQSTGNLKYNCNFSLDKGKTWSAFTGLPAEAKFAQALSNTTIYAVFDASGNGLYDVSKLAKSFDSGKTWTIENQLIYANRISFYDELNGIAMLNQYLQITSDGGKSWKLILSRP